MKLRRSTLFYGLEGQFPKEIQPQMRELCSRLDRAFEELYRQLSNPWLVAADSAEIPTIQDGQRCYIVTDSGQKIAVTIGWETGNGDSP